MRYFIKINLAPHTNLEFNNCKTFLRVKLIQLNKYVKHNLLQVIVQKLYDINNYYILYTRLDY